MKVASVTVEFVSDKSHIKEQATWTEAGWIGMPANREENVIYHRVLSFLENINQTTRQFNGVKNGKR